MPSTIRRTANHADRAQEAHATTRSQPGKTVDRVIYDQALASAVQRDAQTSAPAKSAHVQAHLASGPTSAARIATGEAAASMS